MLLDGGMRITTKREDRSLSFDSRSFGLGKRMIIGEFYYRTGVQAEQYIYQLSCSVVQCSIGRDICVLFSALFRDFYR